MTKKYTWIKYFSNIIKNKYILFNKQKKNRWQNLKIGLCTLWMRNAKTKFKNELSIQKK